MIPGWVGAWFEIYPTWETIGAQVLAAAFVIGSYYAAEHIKVRRPAKRGEPVAEADDLDQWRKWLSVNHATGDPIWVTNSKKDGEAPAVSYLDARDEALCWGWIDSTVNRLGQHR